MTTMTLNIHNNNILESLKQVLSNMVGVEIESVNSTADEMDETEYISSSVDKQIVSSLSGIIGLLEKGIEDINSATKKLVEYKPPQLPQSPFGTVEEQAYIDNLVGGLGLKLDDSLKKILARMSRHRNETVKLLQQIQQKPEPEGQVVPFQSSIQSMEERVLKSIKDNIDSSVVFFI